LRIASKFELGSQPRRSRARALLKIEALSGIPELSAGEARIAVRKPFWLKIST